MSLVLVVTDTFQLVAFRILSLSNRRSREFVGKLSTYARHRYLYTANSSGLLSQPSLSQLSSSAARSSKIISWVPTAAILDLSGFALQRPIHHVQCCCYIQSKFRQQSLELRVLYKVPRSRGCHEKSGNDFFILSDKFMTHQRSSGGHCCQIRQFFVRF